ncbi:unnamed protein product [Ectocarpus sp. 12 AP-2014]
MRQYLDMEALSWLCVAWGVLELGFLAVIMLYLVPRMNRLEAPAKYPIDGKRLIHKVLETVDWLSEQEDADTTFESFLSGWFLGADCSELKRGNLVVFLAWTLYAKEVDALSKAERKNVMSMVKLIEGRLGRTMEPGFNERVKCIRHTLDRVVPFSHRPLALYAVLGLARALLRIVLGFCGFRRRLAPCGSFMYWHRQAPPSGAAAPAAMPWKTEGPGPIVFFHGVGAGLPFYVLALWKMCRHRTSIIVEAPSIMMSLALLRGHTPPSEDQLVESVEGILERHGVKRAAFFGHSFGSISVAWMARRKPHLVSQIVLLDPVCLLLFLPNVARSFLFPDTNGMPLHERLMLYLVTREKGISHTLRRHFWWYANVMWPEDIKCPIVVGLAGQDKIVPCKPLRRYLLSHSTFATSPSCPSGLNMSSVDGLINRGGGGGNGKHNDESVGSSSGTGDGSLRVGSGWTPAGGGGGARGFVTNVNGNNRCKVHKCIGGYKCNGHGGPAASHGSAARPGGLVSAANGGGHVSKAAVSGQSPEAAGKRGIAKAMGDGSDSGGDGVKRVELVYWTDAGHGNVLGDPWALDEFVRVATAQGAALSVN